MATSMRERKLFSGSVNFRNSSLLRFRTFNFKTVKYGGDLYSARNQKVSWSLSSDGDVKGLAILVRGRPMRTLSFAFKPANSRGEAEPYLHLNGVKTAPEITDYKLLEYHGDSLILRKKLASIPGFGTTRIATTRKKVSHVVACADGEENEPLCWPGE
jgi:hypothetical protein